jgi:hypothetical protein
MPLDVCSFLGDVTRLQMTTKLKEKTRRKASHYSFVQERMQIAHNYGPDVKPTVKNKRRLRLWTVGITAKICKGISLSSTYFRMKGLRVFSCKMKE